MVLIIHFESSNPEYIISINILYPITKFYIFEFLKNILYTLLSDTYHVSYTSSYASPKRTYKPNPIFNKNVYRLKPYYKLKPYFYTGMPIDIIPFMY